MILHILMLIFYLSVIYLPTKRLTEQCKSFSQLIVSFTQMSCYNVYVPLLLRVANNVEENPEHTIYVVDRSKTICADFNQGNTNKFRQNAGKQCVAVSLTAIIHNETRCPLGVNSGYFSFLRVHVLQNTQRQENVPL